jgi:hypothetical protein
VETTGIQQLFIGSNQSLDKLKKEKSTNFRKKPVEPGNADLGKPIKLLSRFFLIIRLL